MDLSDRSIDLRSLDGNEAGQVCLDIRSFCLATIREVYGIDYHREWHADLDSLLLSDNGNWYSASNRGAFCVARSGDGEIVATGGLHGFSRKPGTSSRLAGRYGDPDAVCQIVRVYLEPSVRRKGLGRRIIPLLEAKAQSLGYRTAYLHADAQAFGTLRFWQRCGYRKFGRFTYPANGRADTGVDFDKALSGA
jgi:GNAT superfamily N-acetyltransferase